MNYVKSLLCTVMVCTLFLLNVANAQYQVDRNYSAKTIYLKGNKYIKDGLEYPSGFFFQNLKKEMKVSPQAVAEYSRYENKRNTSLFLTTAALVALVASPYVDDRQTRNGLILGGLGLSLVSIPISLKSANHFHKAIWLRNGDALFK